MKFPTAVRVNIATAGQGTVTFGSAADGASFTPGEVGLVDGDVVSYRLTQGTDVEYGTGTVGGSVTTMTRTVTRSKISGVSGTTKLTLAGSAILRIVERGEDIVASANNGSDFADPATVRSNLGDLFGAAEAIKTGDYAVATSDAGKPLIANKATAITFNLPALAGAGIVPYPIRNIGAGDLTLDPNSTEQIEGANTLVLKTGDAAIIWPNGSLWRAMVIRNLSAVTNTEIGYLAGATSAIQTQINTKAPAASPTITGHPTVEGVTSTGATGTGKFVFDGSPTLVAPVLGAAAATTLNLTGGQLQFPATQSASADANNLDDYEEGTWTPADASGASLSFSSVSGRYTKIGRWVSCHAKWTYPSTASGAAAGISGLPFTAANVGGCGSGNLGYSGSATNIAYIPPALNSSNATFFNSAGSNTTNAQMSGSSVVVEINFSV